MPEEAHPEFPARVLPMLREEMFAMLTTVRPDGSLSTNPVSFVFDGERIRISTLKSRKKYRNLLLDDRVAFCAQSSSNPMLYVEVRGRASLDDDPDRAFLREQWMLHSGGMELPADLDPPEAQRVTITVHAEAISAPLLYEGRIDQLFEDEHGGA
jgi:PPOX class probable F420-dependent enzyme